jgi:hypothetical protein
MSVPKSLTLAAAVVFGLSTFEYGASRPRDRSSSSYRADSVQRANVARGAVGSYGGYSPDPKIRALEILADKYRPREWQWRE